MADVLDLNLDSFDLEDVMSSSSNHTNGMNSSSGGGGTKSVTISPSGSRPSSVPVSSHMPTNNGFNSALGSSRPQSSMNISDDFGLDMLANPGKIDDINQSAPSPSKTSGGGGGIFGSLFGGGNNGNNGGGNNNKTPTPPSKAPTPLPGNNNNRGVLFGGAMGGGSLDLDKEMENLDAGLNSNINKAHGLGANISRPTTSMGMGGPSLMGNGQPSSMSMTYEEMERQKFILLQKFESLRKKGVKIPKVFSMQSDYDEMKNEYEALENQRRMDISVRMQRTWLLNAVNGIEMLNNNYDPFDIDLDGWGESLNEDLLSGDYDDIFEELYEKYKGYGNYPPEIRLIMGVAGSGFAFHMQKRVIAGMGINSQQILRDNPHIARQMQDAAQKSASQQMPGLSNFMGLFNSKRGGDQGPPLYPGTGGGNSDIPDLNTVLNS